MLLAYPRLFDSALEIKESSVTSIVIENRKEYRLLIESLHNLYNNNNSGVVISDDSELKGSEIEIITDLFSLDINKKALLNKLYSKTEKGIDEYLETIHKINTEISGLMLKLSEKSMLDIYFKDFIEIKELLKLMDFRIDTSLFEDSIDKLLNYMIACRDYLGIKVFFLDNLRVIMEEDEMEVFLKDIRYNELNVVFLDTEVYNRENIDNVYVVDKDLCLI